MILSLHASRDWDVSEAVELRLNAGSATADPDFGGIPIGAARRTDDLVLDPGLSLHADGRLGQQESLVRREEGEGLRIGASALLLSVLVHVIALAAAITLRPQPLPESMLSETVTAIEIGLLPAREPELAIPEPAPAESVAPEPIETADESSAEAAPANTEPTVEEIVDSAAPIPVESLTVESTPPEILPDSEEPDSREPVPALPDVLSVRQSVRAVGEADRARVWLNDCNPLEEEAGIKDCGPGSRGNFARLDYNRTYQNLNGPQLMPRSLKALPALTGNRAELLGRLRDSDLGADRLSLVEQQLEEAITHWMDPGNRGLRHMDTVTDRSAAGQMQRELLGDPWVVEAARQRALRSMRLNTTEEP